MCRAKGPTTVKFILLCFSLSFFRWTGMSILSCPWTLTVLSQSHLDVYWQSLLVFQAFLFWQKCTPSSPGSPACRWQNMGLLNLQNFITQFLQQISSYIHNSFCSFGVLFQKTLINILCHQPPFLYICTEPCVQQNIHALSYTCLRIQRLLSSIARCTLEHGPRIISL